MRGEQLVSSTLTNMTPSGTVHKIYDLDGNLLVETDGAGNTVREYMWLPQGAAVAQNTVGTARPLAVVSDVNTATPKLYFVHVDHLQRPIMMTDSTKANVWAATWLPFGGAHSITGTAANDNRFPGQWFQIETNLHYNWNRHYDPTTGRYTQADPLGLIDGPSVYAYAGSNPQNFIDATGEVAPAIVWGAAAGARIAAPHVGRYLGHLFRGTALAGLGSLFGDAPKDPWICAIPSNLDLDTGNILQNNKGAPQSEKKPTDAPPGTVGIDKAKRKHGLTTDDVHDIKDNVGNEAKDWTGVTPDGTVGINDGNGKWSPQGNVQDLINR